MQEVTIWTTTATLLWIVWFGWAFVTLLTSTTLTVSSSLSVPHCVCVLCVCVCVLCVCVVCLCCVSVLDCKMSVTTSLHLLLLCARTLWSCYSESELSCVFVCAWAMQAYSLIENDSWRTNTLDLPPVHGRGAGHRILHDKLVPHTYCYSEYLLPKPHGMYHDLLVFFLLSAINFFSPLCWILFTLQLFSLIVPLMDVWLFINNSCLS